MDQGFKEAQQSKPCSADTSVNICVVIGKRKINVDDSIYFIQTGFSKIVVSTNYGKEVDNPGKGDEKEPVSNKYRYYIKKS